MKVETAFAGFFLVVGGAGIAIVGILSRCYVLAKLWDWYAVPFFHQPVMPLAYAFGFSVLMAMLTTKRTKSDDDKMWEMLAFSLFSSAFALSLGALGAVFLP